jgi:hypothetical protein
LNELSSPSGPGPGTSLPHLPRRIFFSPGELFRGLREDPAVWGALLTGAITLLLTTLATPLEVWEAGIRERILEAGGTLPADARQIARFTRMGGAFAVLVFWPLGAVLQAAMFAGLFLFGLGYEGRFRQYLAVTAHAGLVVALVGVVLLPFRILTRRPDLSPSLDSFLPFLEEGLFARWLGFLDLINFWVFALVGLGAAIVDGRGREGASIGIAMGAAALVFLVVASFMG